MPATLPCWSSRPQVRKMFHRPRSVMVGLVAASGYGLASYFSGVKIRRGLLALIIIVQFGAYVAALLAIQKVPFVFCALAAMLVSVLARLAIGFPALRLRGDYQTASRRPLRLAGWPEGLP